MADVILRACPVCSKQLTAKQLTKNPKRIACSMACASEMRTRKSIDRNKRECAGCGKEFSARSKAKYCSKPCMVDARRPLHMQCRGCGVAFTPIRIHSRTKRYCTAYSSSFIPFCMPSCDAKRRVAAGINCKACGVLFTPVRWDSKARAFYAHSSNTTCSSECHRSAYPITEERRLSISIRFSRDGHPNWQGGSHREGFRGHEWLDIAEQVREKAGRCCERCGKTQLDNGRRLDVNHKIPFHQFKRKTEANRISNLEALCRSCHTRTDWVWRKKNSVQFSLPLR